MQKIKHKENSKKIPCTNKSFENLFSSTFWRDLEDDIRKYFSAHKNYFKLIGINVAIAGLFLNLQPKDIYLRRINAFFLLMVCVLITLFILRSLRNLLRGKHTELYCAIVLIPAFIGGVLIFNFFKYLINNFAAELLFYFHTIGVPLIAIGVNLAFLAFFKNFSKIKNIEGSQLEFFFLVTLNLNLGISYINNDYSFLKTLHDILSFDFYNLSILYLFFLTLWSELRPLKRTSKWSVIYGLALFALLIVLPFLLKYLLPKIICLIIINY